MAEAVAVFEAPASATKLVQTPPVLLLVPCVTVSCRLSPRVLVCENDEAVA